MKSKWTFIGSLLTVLLLVLTMGRGQAQEPQPPVSPRVGGTDGGFLPATVGAAPAAALGTDFTYQGQLKKDGAPVNGTCDLQFGLWNAASGGAQIGTTQTRTNVPVSNGYFTIPDLDFGAAAFQGDARWLAVAVRCPAGSGSYTTLSPRQALTAAPYALSLRPGAVVSDAKSSVELNRYVAGTLDRQYGVYAKAQGAYYDVGLYGEANGSTDVGVAGYSSSGWGVYGESAHAAGYGVFGFNGSGSGVYGRTDSGRGVYGEATATAGYGVYAENPNGTAIYAVGRNAVVGMSSTPNYAAVFGRNTTSTGVGYGVYGQTESTAGTGVYGIATAGYGEGVYGHSNLGKGVRGETDTGYGVYGKSSNGYAVYGWRTGGTEAAIHGITTAANGTGVAGIANNGSSANGIYGGSTSGTGVYGASTSGTGVYGVSGTGYAGWFAGKVRVEGGLEKHGGGFKIDHPLDPANQYLNHSFVESPDMKNIYDGVVTLDANGEAVVQLPDWFGALNRDFRYQLTCIGGYAPVYIAEEIQDNRFKIAGGQPGLKVSWQVTGIRQDPWANDHRIAVEEDKSPEEQGAYLYPAGYGQPAEMGVDYQRNRDLFAQLEREPSPARGGE